MKCRVCKIQMIDGIAIKNKIWSSGEGTCSRTGEPILVDVYKCPQCGKSIEN